MSLTTKFGGSRLPLDLLHKLGQVSCVEAAIPLDIRIVQAYRFENQTWTEHGPDAKRLTNTNSHWVFLLSLACSRLHGEIRGGFTTALCRYSSDSMLMGHDRDGTDFVRVRYRRTGIHQTVYSMSMR